MAGLKSLLKDTAIYGISSIVGRFLNYLLVPIYAASMSAASGGYGVVTEVYAWTALLMVILTYGMETSFFRFVNKEEENPKKVYSTVLTMVGGTSLLFAILCMVFLQPIASMMGYAEHPWYVGMMTLVVAMDAFQCLPFSYLRYKRKPLAFAGLKMLFIILNIALNLIYYVGMGGSDVFYAFFFNLICTSTIMLLLIPQLKFGGGFDASLAKRMLKYGYPILILGIAHHRGNGMQEDHTQGGKQQRSAAHHRQDGRVNLFRIFFFLIDKAEEAGFHAVSEDDHQQSRPCIHLGHHAIATRCRTHRCRIDRHQQVIQETAYDAADAVDGRVFQE